MFGLLSPVNSRVWQLCGFSKKISMCKLQWHLDSFLLGRFNANLKMEKPDVSSWSFKVNYTTGQVQVNQVWILMLILRLGGLKIHTHKYIKDHRHNFEPAMHPRGWEQERVWRNNRLVRNLAVVWGEPVESWMIATKSLWCFTSHHQAVSKLLVIGYFFYFCYYGY